MILPGSYANGFAPRDGQPLYPELWKGCVGAWNPGLGVTGLTLRDASGFQNNGTLTNGPTWSLNQGRYALNFDGTNDTVITSKTDVLAGNSCVSVSYWIQKSTSGSDAIVGSSLSSSSGVWLQWYTDGNVYFSFRNGTTASVSYALSYSTGWIHLCGTKSGATGQIYVNGQQVASGALDSQLSATTAAFVISGIRSTFYTTGKHDDVMLYDRQLSGNEVRLLASRRGIAYEMAPRRRSSVQVTVAPLRYNLFSGSIGNTDVIGAS